MDNYWKESSLVVCISKVCDFDNCKAPKGCFLGSPELNFKDSHRMCFSKSESIDKGLEDVLSYSTITGKTLSKPSKVNLLSKSLDLCAPTQEDCDRFTTKLYEPLDCHGNGIIQRKELTNEEYCICGSPISPLVPLNEISQITQLKPNGWGGKGCDIYYVSPNGPIEWLNEDPNTRKPFISSTGEELPGIFVIMPIDYSENNNNIKLVKLGGDPLDENFWRTCCEGYSSFKLCPYVPCRIGTTIECEESSKCLERNPKDGPLVYPCNNHGKPLADGSCECEEGPNGEWGYISNLNEFEFEGCYIKIECQKSELTDTICGNIDQCNNPGELRYPLPYDPFIENQWNTCPVRGPPNNKEKLDLLSGEEDQFKSQLLDALSSIANRVISAEIALNGCICVKEEDDDFEEYNLNEINEQSPYCCMINSYIRNNTISSIPEIIKASYYNTSSNINDNLKLYKTKRYRENYMEPYKLDVSIFNITSYENIIRNSIFKEYNFSLNNDEIYYLNNNINNKILIKTSTENVIKKRLIKSLTNWGIDTSLHEGDTILSSEQIINTSSSSILLNNELNIFNNGVKISPVFINLKKGDVISFVINKNNTINKYDNNNKLNKYRASDVILDGIRLFGRNKYIDTTIEFYTLDDNKKHDLLLETPLLSTLLGKKNLCSKFKSSSSSSSTTTTTTSSLNNEIKDIKLSVSYISETTTTEEEENNLNNEFEWILGNSDNSNDATILNNNNLGELGGIKYCNVEYICLDSRTYKDYSINCAAVPDSEQCQNYKKEQCEFKKINNILPIYHWPLNDINSNYPGCDRTAEPDGCTCCISITSENIIKGNDNHIFYMKLTNGEFDLSKIRFYGHTKSALDIPYGLSLLINKDFSDSIINSNENGIIFTDKEKENLEKSKKCQDSNYLLTKLGADKSLFSPKLTLKEYDDKVTFSKALSICENDFSGSLAVGTPSTDILDRNGESIQLLQKTCGLISKGSDATCWINAISSLNSTTITRNDIVIKGCDKEGCFEKDKYGLYHYYKPNIWSLKLSPGLSTHSSNSYTPYNYLISSSNIQRCYNEVEIGNFTSSSEAFISKKTILPYTVYKDILEKIKFRYGKYLIRYKTLHLKGKNRVTIIRIRNKMSYYDGTEIILLRIFSDPIAMVTHPTYNPKRDFLFGEIINMSDLEYTTSEGLKKKLTWYDIVSIATEWNDSVLMRVLDCDDVKKGHGTDEKFGKIPFDFGFKYNGIGYDFKTKKDEEDFINGYKMGEPVNAFYIFSGFHRTFSGYKTSTNPRLANSYCCIEGGPNWITYIQWVSLRTWVCGTWYCSTLSNDLPKERGECIVFHKTKVAVNINEQQYMGHYKRQPIFTHYLDIEIKNKIYPTRKDNHIFNGFYDESLDIGRRNNIDEIIDINEYPCGPLFIDAKIFGWIGKNEKITSSLINNNIILGNVEPLHIIRNHSNYYDKPLYKGLMDPSEWIYERDNIIVEDKSLRSEYLYGTKEIYDNDGIIYKSDTPIYATFSLFDLDYKYEENGNDIFLNYPKINKCSSCRNLNLRTCRWDQTSYSRSIWMDKFVCNTPDIRIKYPLDIKLIKTDVSNLKEFITERWTISSRTSLLSSSNNIFGNYLKVINSESIYKKLGSFLNDGEPDKVSFFVHQFNRIITDTEGLSITGLYYYYYNLYREKNIYQGDIINKENILLTKTIIDNNNNNINTITSINTSPLLSLILSSNLEIAKYNKAIIDHLFFKKKYLDWTVPTCIYISSNGIDYDVCEKSSHYYICSHNWNKHSVRSGSDCDNCGPNTLSLNGPVPEVTCYDAHELADRKKNELFHTIKDHYLAGTLDTFIETSSLFKSSSSSSNDDESNNYDIELKKYENISTYSGISGMWDLIKKRYNTQSSTNSESSWCNLCFNCIWPHNCGTRIDKKTNSIKRYCAKNEILCNTNLDPDLNYEDAKELGYNVTMNKNKIPKILFPTETFDDALIDRTCVTHINLLSYFKLDSKGGPQLSMLDNIELININNQNDDDDDDNNNNNIENPINFIKFKTLSSSIYRKPMIFNGGKFPVKYIFTWEVLHYISFRLSMKVQEDKVKLLTPTTVKIEFIIHTLSPYYLFPPEFYYSINKTFDATINEFQLVTLKLSIPRSSYGGSKMINGYEFPLHQLKGLGFIFHNVPKNTIITMENPGIINSDGANICLKRKIPIWYEPRGRIESTVPNNVCIKNKKDQELYYNSEIGKCKCGKSLAGKGCDCVGVTSKYGENVVCAGFGDGSSLIRSPNNPLKLIQTRGYNNGYPNEDGCYIWEDEISKEKFSDCKTINLATVLKTTLLTSSIYEEPSVYIENDRLISSIFSSLSKNDNDDPLGTINSNILETTTTTTTTTLISSSSKYNFNSFDNVKNKCLSYGMTMPYTYSLDDITNLIQMLNNNNEGLFMDINVTSVNNITKWPWASAIKSPSYFILEEEYENNNNFVKIRQNSDLICFMELPNSLSIDSIKTCSEVNYNNLAFGSIVSSLSPTSSPTIISGKFLVDGDASTIIELINPNQYYVLNWDLYFLKKTSFIPINEKSSLYITVYIFGDIILQSSIPRCIHTSNIIFSTSKISINDINDNGNGCSIHEKDSITGLSTDGLLPYQIFSLGVSFRCKVTTNSLYVYIKNQYLANIKEIQVFSSQDEIRSIVYTYT